MKYILKKEASYDLLNSSAMNTNWVKLFWYLSLQFVIIQEPEKQVNAEA